MAGGAKEGQHIRNLVKQLVAHPAEEGLPYPTLTREDVRCIAREIVQNNTTILFTYVRDLFLRSPVPPFLTTQVHVVNRRAALRDASPEEDLFDGKSKSVAGRETLDQWQHCASVLCNTSRIPEGR